MFPRSPVCRRRLFLIIALWVLLLSRPGFVQATMIDLNGNGMSDIWELIYNANGLDPNADSDGDGVINLLESIAGTDPLDPNSLPKISFAAVAGTNFAVIIQSAVGKQYVLESAEPTSDGTWTNWVPQASAIARSGSTLTLTN